MTWMLCTLKVCLYNHQPQANACEQRAVNRRNLRPTVATFARKKTTTRQVAVEVGATSERAQKHRSNVAILALMFVVGGCGLISSPVRADDADKQTAIKISKETTVISGPLDSRGFVNYVAAIDRMQREGVKPDDNAAVYLARATGMRELANSPDRGRYFQALGMQPVPVGGKSVDWHAFAAKIPETAQLDHAILLNRWSRGMESPWTAEDDVVLARWLEANDEAIELMVRASRCSRYYAPLLGDENAVGPQMVLVLLPLVQEVRHVARMLSIRAMYRIGNDDLQGAFEDSLAIHRISRLVGKGPTLIDVLVGIACDGIACGIDARIARHPKLRSQQALRFLAQLDKLTAFDSIASKFDVTERFTMLDAVTSIVRDGAKSLKTLIVFEDFGPGAELLIPVFTNTGVDWNQVLRTTNATYDRVTAALKQPIRRQRKQALLAVQRDIDALKSKAAQKKALALAFISKNHRTEWMSNVLTGAMLPGILQIATAADRAVVKIDQVRLAYALAAYRADQERYPESLDPLVPK
ncbi:MAG: hypothetical protein O3A00_27830, partial [Planctomycetota bacterium]|nr:hypothetical protein [Planctomycetota bacterium]